MSITGGINIRFLRIRHFFQRTTVRLSFLIALLCIEVCLPIVLDDREWERFGDTLSKAIMAIGLATIGDWIRRVERNNKLRGPR